MTPTNCSPTILSMEVSSKDDSDYRILLQNKIRYLTIRPGTFNRSTLSTPLSSLPSLPGDHTWNCALINRDPSNHQLTIELQNRNLTGITDIWHPLQIDCLQLRRTRQLTATAFEATYCGSKLPSTTTLEKNTTVIVKIARFEWEIPRLSQETSIYKQNSYRTSLILLRAFWAMCTSMDVSLGS